jgi:NMD protein affecting ribosome stability and mRNA decay
MHESYCFDCGSYTRIDDVTKLCGRCYRNWLDRKPLPR